MNTTRVGDVAGEAHLVGDDDQRGAGLGELADDVQDLVDQFRVQGRGGLVEEQDLGVQGKGPGDRDALLLAAGKLARVGVGAVLQAHPVQQFQPAFAGLGLGEPRFSGPRRDDGGLGDVFQRGQVREEVEVLEHHADLGALLQDLLFAQLVEPVAADLVAHQRRRRCAMNPPSTFSRWLMVRSRVDLPDPEGPTITATPPGLDRQRDALEDFRGAEGLADLGDLDEAAGGVGGRGGRRRRGFRWQGCSSGAPFLGVSGRRGMRGEEFAGLLQRGQGQRADRALGVVPLDVVLEDAQAPR